MIQAIVSATAGLIVLAVYIPYALDILRGRVQTSRATRAMFAVLLVIVLLQQRDLDSGWAMAITAGEALGSIAILVLSFSRGMGGLQRLDIVCYFLLAIDILCWQLSSNTLLALHLSILADVIACMPMFYKTWRHPRSETPLFYIGGVAAPLLSVIASPSYQYAVLVFPLYLALANVVQLGIMYRHTLVVRA